MNTHIPTKYGLFFLVTFSKILFIYKGGLGLGILDSCIVTEELAYG
jgi:hypothetical protein